MRLRGFYLVELLISLSLHPFSLLLNIIFHEPVDLFHAIPFRVRPIKCFIDLIYHNRTERNIKDLLQQSR